MNSLLLLIHLILFGTPYMAEQKQNMIVNISDIRDKDPNHIIYVAVSRKCDDFPANPDVVSLKAIIPPTSGQASISLPDIPYGKYAIMIFQDLNGNKKLDKNFLGMPKEPFAFSNNYRPLFRGPKWKDCEIEYSEKNFVFDIKGLISL